MALSNRDRVGKSLDLLKEGLKTYVEREMRSEHGDAWEKKAEESVPELRKRGKNEDKWDVQALLSLINNNWNGTFGKTLGRFERSLVIELRDVRNNWAHQNPFVYDDAYRALDSIQRLLVAIGSEHSAEAEKHKREVQRLRYEEESKKEIRSSSTVSLEGKPQTDLKSWRMLITPHKDVREGSYQQAEFAADLWQVHKDEGSEEYRDPIEFYKRTFLTDGLKQLLTGALKRVTGKGGDPVIELQTNFGGGKTHSMLALYHLFSGGDIGKLYGMEPLLKEAGVSKLPAIKRAVFVGSYLSPVQNYKKTEKVTVRTMWGEIAYQLGCYDLIADADKRGVSPGAEVFQEVLKKASPCIILIDEWVAYARLLHEENDLPGGSFDSCLTFAQSLTEAVKAVPTALLVASIPSSDIEVGGDKGRTALERLRNTFGRVSSSWKPASADEGFEIVRRRLFEALPNESHPAKDAVVRAFSDFYRKEASEFPSECKEAEYRRRMEAAYPIHPELFDRLYEEWSRLDTFQRTRGVLRFMASVIHELWVRQDTNLMILPSMVPVDAPTVKDNLLRYLEPTWSPVIEKDIDGPSSLPLRLDGQNPNFGRVSAARRVARTLFIGSAPTLQSSNKGLEDLHIKLGCAQPGESVAVFGDALRRLTDQASHIYVDGKRYWCDPQPSVTRLAQDRGSQLKIDDVQEEIKRRLREQGKRRGEFSKVHTCPASSADVPDELETRLVILGPEFQHQAKNGKNLPSSARDEAIKILETRASGHRTYKNTLVFLAADKARIAELESAVRSYLAWKSIEEERETLNLDAFNSKQATSKRKESDETVEHRIPQTYSWVLSPYQADPQAPVDMQEKRLQGDEDLAPQAFKKLKNEETITPELAGTVLRHWLDKIPLWRGNHVSLKQLVEDFAQYLYLPRLKDPNVILASVEDGIGRITWSADSFGYADRYDESAKRYVGLVAGARARATISGDSVVVKPELALAQLNAEVKASSSAVAGTPTQVSAGTSTDGVSAPTAPTKEPENKYRRFHGSVSLNATRLPRDVGQIADGVVQHLTSLLGSNVEITLEISAQIPDGAPENVVRTVNENCRTLKFKTSEFEKE